VNETRDLLEQVGERFRFPDQAFERLERRRERKRRNQRIAAGVVGIAVFVAAVWIVTSDEVAIRDGSEPGASGSTSPSVPTTDPWVAPPVTTAPWVTPDATSEVDFLMDVNTGETTPLPGTILAPAEDLGGPAGRSNRYAASPDGATLAFTGLGDEGTSQIFVANVDGTDVRQVTHDPNGAVEPAWSPDGGSIAYIGNVRPNLIGSLFVLDVATGVSTKVGDVAGHGPSFTPDGSALLYVASGPGYPLELRTVPIAGGESRPLFAADAGIGDSGNGSISPDGSLVTFLGSGTPPTDEVSHCGPCRFIANVDGTNRQVIGGWMANPAGTWSPDGTRIVGMDYRGQLESRAFQREDFTKVIVVVDVATEEATIVAYGRMAIWLDDHTLLVEV
jgi:hypothetical protein